MPIAVLSRSIQRQRQETVSQMTFAREPEHRDSVGFILFGLPLERTCIVVEITLVACLLRPRARVVPGISRWSDTVLSRALPALRPKTKGQLVKKQRRTMLNDHLPDEQFLRLLCHAQKWSPLIPRCNGHSATHSTSLEIESEGQLHLACRIGGIRSAEKRRCQCAHIVLEGHVVEQIEYVNAKLYLCVPFLLQAKIFC